jgi:hypothetical protein
MSKVEFIDEVHALGLEPFEYVLCASATLAALGLRENKDIDMVVTDSVFNRLMMAHPEAFDLKDDGVECLTIGNLEIFREFKIVSRKNIFEKKMLVDGIPVMGLRQLRHWKFLMGREKDKHDIALIDAYLQKHNIPHK